ASSRAADVRSEPSTCATLPPVRASSVHAVPSHQRSRPSGCGYQPAGPTSTSPPPPGAVTVPRGAAPVPDGRGAPVEPEGTGPAGVADGTEPSGVEPGRGGG